MTKEQEVIKQLKELHISSNTVRDDIDYLRDEEAIDYAIKALEVVEKIKKAFHNGWFEDDIYNILCEAYGSDTDCESWLKEVENEV